MSIALLRTLRTTTLKNTRAAGQTFVYRYSSARMSSDAYTKKTEDKYGEASLADKVAEVDAIIKKIGTSMLTTVGTDGKSLHSRAMRDASHDKMIFHYVYDNTSHKNDEVRQDQAVNISFLEPKGGDWISVAGKATTSTDQALKDKVYNPITKAWFGDLGDGVHDGTAKDPRVTVMIIKPDEIRYYASKSNMLSSAVQIVASAVTGDTAAPGVVRTITGQEVDSLQ